MALCEAECTLYQARAAKRECGKDRCAKSGSGSRSGRVGALLDICLGSHEDGFRLIISQIVQGPFAVEAPILLQKEKHSPQVVSATVFVQNLESLFNPGNDVVVLELPNGEAHGVLTFFSPANNVAVVIPVQDCCFGKPDFSSGFIGRQAAALLSDKLLSRRKTARNGVCQAVFPFPGGERGAKGDTGKVSKFDGISLFSPLFEESLELVHDFSITRRQRLGLWFCD